MSVDKTYSIFLLCICSLIVSCTRRSNNYSCVPIRVQPRTTQAPIKQPVVTEVSTPKIINETLTASEVFEKFNSAVCMIFTSNGISGFQGSGFFVNSNGLAVSNYHVFKGTGVGWESIKLSNGKECKVREVVAKDEDNDFILFYVDITDECNYIPISNRTKKVGEKVYTNGSPRGLENTFSSGEISQFRGDNVIQINAPIDHGSSGGALINEYGEVIGITSAGLDDSGANLNFAMDIDVVKPYIR